MRVAMVSSRRFRGRHAQRLILFGRRQRAGDLCTDELELTLCDCRRCGRCNRQLLAECNSGFEVRYRSVPTVQSGYTITH